MSQLDQLLLTECIEMKGIACDLPSHEEVRKSCEDGPNGHEEAPYGNEPGPVQLGPKMADHSQKQQVA